MNFIDNTNKCTCVKIHTATHDPLRLQHILLIFRSSSGS